MRCKFFVLLFLLSVNIYASALAIDEASLLNAIEQNDNTLDERKILVNYYIKQHRYDDATTMNDELLAKAPKDKIALKQHDKITLERKYYNLLKKNNLSEDEAKPSSNFFDVSKQSNRDIYTALSYFKRDFNPRYHENMIRYYIVSGEFEKAHKALSYKIQLSEVNTLRLQAELTEAEKDNQKAAKLYQKTYKQSGKIEDALALLRVQIDLKNYAAIMLYSQLQQRFKADPALRPYNEPIKALKKLQLTTLKAHFEKENTLQALQPYANTLFGMHKRQQAISITHDFYTKNTTSESALFLAQLYYWNGNYQNSITVLEAQPTPRTTAIDLLLGKLYNNTKQFEKAKKILQPLTQSDDNTVGYEAKKQLTYIRLWEGDQDRAIKAFNALLREHNDADIQKTLTYLAYSDEEKITYFEQQLQKNPHDKLAKITLAQLYLKNKETQGQGIELLKQNAATYQTEDDYLLLAQNAYWASEDDLALSTLNKILEKEPTHPKALVLQKEIRIAKADKLYFTSDYKGALAQYDLLEKEGKLDDSTRLHQAISLEQEKRYTRAKAKFSEIYHYDQRDYILFHIAFNTMQQKQYEAAKSDFSTVVTHENNSSEDPSIYTYAKANLVFIEAKLNEPKPVILSNGLVMAPLVTKDILNNQEVFNTSTAQSLSPQAQQNKRQPRFNLATIGLEYYRNKDDIEYYAFSTSYTRKNLLGRWGLGADIGYFSISSPDALGIQDGSTLGISISSKHLKVRLGLNHYEAFDEFAPVITYHNHIKAFSYELEYAYQNAMFYTKSPQALYEQIGTNHFIANTYYYGGERWNLYSSIALNVYENSNTAFVPQFDYNFYRFIFTKNFSIATSLNGWYMFNSNENSSYYSPKHYDSTLVGLRPSWTISQYVILNAIADLGYSFDTPSALYNFGLNLSMPEKNGLSYQLGCRESNAARNDSLSTIDYYEVECTGLLEYRWQ